MFAALNLGVAHDFLGANGRLDKIMKNITPDVYKILYESKRLQNLDKDGLVYREDEWYVWTPFRIQNYSYIKARPLNKKQCVINHGYQHICKVEWDSGSDEQRPFIRSILESLTEVRRR